MRASVLTPSHFSMELRDYQLEAVEALDRCLRRGDNPLLVGATGVGKSVIIKALLEMYIKRYPKFRCVILVNKVTLVRQFRDKYFPTASIYCGSENSKCLHDNVVIATVQSVVDVRALFHLVVLDECHCADQDMAEGMYTTFINNCKSVRPQVKVLGATATPFNSKGHVYGKGKLFKGPTYQKDLLWSIEHGFLCTPTIKHSTQCFDTSKLSISLGEFSKKAVAALVSDVAKVKAQVADALSKLGDKKKVIWSCANINHAEQVREMLENAVTVHSKMSKQEIEASINSFQNDCTVRHLTFVTIVSEGYDQPSIDAVVLMRPMKSPKLMIQTVGRGLRPSEGKRSLLVLDYGEVFLNCGTLDAPIITTGNKRSARDTVKFCPECLEIIDINLKKCMCGHVFIREKVDALANTTLSTSASDVLSKAPEYEYLDVTRISFDNYKSKKGSNCLRIIYTVKGPLGERIFEYFVQGQEWLGVKFKKRLHVLGLPEYLYKFSGVNYTMPNTTDYKIKVIRNGKYYQVKDLVYEK